MESENIYCVTYYLIIIIFVAQTMTLTTAA